MSNREDFTEEDNTNISFVSFDDFISGTTGSQATHIHSIESVRFSFESNDLYAYDTPGAYSRILTGDKSSGRYDPRRFRRNRFIPMGMDNKYPSFIVGLTKRSHTHKSAYRTAVNMAMGGGYKYDSVENPEFVKSLKQWMNDVGFDKKFQKGALKSVANFGGAFVDIKFRDIATPMEEDGTGGDEETLVTIQISNFIERRLGKPEDDIKSEDLGTIVYHWNNKLMHDTLRKTNPSNWKGIPVFRGIHKRKDSDTLINEGGTPFYIKDELANKGQYSYLIGGEEYSGSYYPDPPFESNGAINAILMEEALSYFDLSGIQNGLSAGYIVIAPLKDTRKQGEVAEKLYNKKKDAITSKLLREVTGEDNNGNVIVMFQDPRTKNPGIQIAEIPNTNTSEMHKTLEERKRISIMTAWSVIDERLIGVPNITSKGQSSQAEALKTAEEIFYKLKVEPDIIQPVKNFVDEVLIPLFLDMFNLTEEDIPKDFTHGFKRNRLFDSTPSDEILKLAYGINEIRANFGDGPVPEEILQELLRRNSELIETKQQDPEPKKEED